MDIALSVLWPLWIFYFLHYFLSESVIQNIFYFFVEENFDEHYGYSVMPVSGSILTKFIKILKNIGPNFLLVSEMPWPLLGYHLLLSHDGIVP